MKIAEDKLKRICGKRGISLKQLLEMSGVSKNAFYTLARKKSVLPNSIKAISETLDICPEEFLEISLTPVQLARQMSRTASEIAGRHSGADRDNILHTLQLLEENPVDRLRRALTRAQRFNFQ